MKKETQPERAVAADCATAVPRDAALQDIAQAIVCDAHRSPREYIRRANTQQQGE